MAERHHDRTDRESVDVAPEETDAPAAGDTRDLVGDLDDLLDEIDEVLESNAEEFVKGYVQKGGE